MTTTAPLAPYAPDRLPAGVRSRFIAGVQGLRMHVLEAGWPVDRPMDEQAGGRVGDTTDRTVDRAADQPASQPANAGGGRPCVLLLHGFPELAYSWRRIMPALAQAGYHVLAPDLRGYGRTTGWTPGFDVDLHEFRLLNVVRDVLGLVSACGLRRVAAVIGHDFGSPVAAWCALVRPDVFGSVVMMSAPFGGPPPLPPGFVDESSGGASVPASRPVPIEALAALPRARKHYQWYYSTREADADMRGCAQGLSAFMRAYYHHKSADWEGNQPHPLSSWQAEELAAMPTYYIMDRDQDMAQTVAPFMPSAQAIAGHRWLPDDALQVYVEEYQRTGFQGALNWYRSRTTGMQTAELQLFAGRTIDVPSCFIAGRQDWGVFQSPGEFERMQQTACTHLLGCHLIEGAGHWVQQEQPDAVAHLLVDFLRRVR